VGLLGLPFEHETWTATGSARIGRFLHREKGFQQWRILRLLQCGAVELTRGGTKSKLAKADEVIKPGDQIELLSPLPQPCANALQNIPQTDYRDYVFANANPADDYERYVIRYLQLHPQTEVLSGPTVESLTSFVKALAHDERLTHPIRHLIIASHASSSGLLALKLDAATSAQIINYEALETAAAGKQLEIDPQLLEPRPRDANNNVIPAQVHIKGCSIGHPNALPFLQLLKKALGGKVGVTAPRFFHSLKPVTLTKRRGRRVISRSLVELWEFFSYDFTLYRTSPLRNKADAVAAFETAFKTDPNAQRIDGVPVPKADWERWLPGTLPPANGQPAAFELPVVSSLSTKANTAGVRLWYQTTSFLSQQWHKIPLASDPGTDANRKQEIKRQAPAFEKRLSPAHPFPLYARMGFKTLDAYFDSYDWQFKYDAQNKELSFSGTRHEYTLLAPVVNPANNELYMNLFPVSGTPTIKITEGDTRFFTSI
jgi:hypothetical protein